jgi:predicted alpha/beta hydrolase family esterase
MVEAVLFDVQVQPITRLQGMGVEIIIAHALGGLKVIKFRRREVLAVAGRMPPLRMMAMLSGPQTLRTFS